MTLFKILYYFQQDRLHTSTWCDILKGAKDRFCGGGLFQSKGPNTRSEREEFPKAWRTIGPLLTALRLGTLRPTEFRVRAERTATCPRLVSSHGTRMDSVSWKGCTDRKNLLLGFSACKKKKKLLKVGRARVSAPEGLAA